MTQNVQFDESQFTQKTNNTQPTGMTYFLIKKKIVKNVQQASIVLFCVAVVFLLISFLIFTHTHNQTEKTINGLPDPADVL